MRFRTLALALALSCGMAGMAEAKHKPHQAKSAHKANPKFKQARSRKVSPRKMAKRAKQRRKTG